MIKFRGVLFISGALLFALISAALVSSFLKKTEPSKIRIVVAATDIEPGDLLGADNLKTVSRPKRNVPANSFKSVKRLAGRQAASRIYTGEPIKEERLMPAGAAFGAGLSAQVKSGMRAVSIKVDAVSGISGMLAPGDLVDIIATDRIAGSKGGRVSRIILQKIRVFSINYNQKGTAEKKSSKTTVTLLLTPAEAGVLAAAEGSRFRLAARSPLDKAMESGEDTTYSALFGCMTSTKLKENETEKDRLLNAAIKHGERAVTLAINDLDGICGFLLPGNKVDVVATSRAGNIAVENLNPGSKGRYLKTDKLSKTILQNITVLAVDQKAGVQPENASKNSDNSGRPAPLKPGNSAKMTGGNKTAWSEAGSNVKSAMRVTLLLTPQKAEKIAVACLEADIKLIRRNNSDEEISNLQGRKLVSCFFPQYRARFFDIYIYRGGQGDSIRGFRIKKLKKQRFYNPNRFTGYDNDLENL